MNKKTSLNAKVKQFIAHFSSTPMRKKEASRMTHRTFLRSCSIALILLSLGGYKLSAQCLTSSLNITTGEYNLSVLAPGNNDPLWTCIGKTGTFTGSAPAPVSPALIVVNNAGWFPSGVCGSWLCDNQSHANGIPVTAPSNLTFERSFCLRADAQVTFNMSFHADGIISHIFVDGVATSFVQPSTPATWGPGSSAWPVNFTQSLSAGPHQLQIEVSDQIQVSNGDPIGFTMAGTISAGSAIIVDNQNANCSVYACDKPSPPASNCNDSCYWKVTGNSIINGNNIFGTLSNDNVKIFTNNTSRGIITNSGRFGFGGTSPGNTVEITGSGMGTSGLRFSNLNSGSTTASNPGKVLSLDPSGDVILVDDGGTGAATANNGTSISSDGHVTLGQDCDNGSGAELLNNRVVPMNDHNILFRDGKFGEGVNRIGIGTSGCYPGAKLEVIRNDEGLDIDNYPIAFAAYNRDIATRGGAFGIIGEATNNKNRNNYAGKFEARDGVDGTYAVLGGATSQGYQAVGGHFEACGAYINTGVFASACNSYNNGGGPSYAGYFDGDVFSTTSFWGSDRKIKKNIEPIANALELLNKMQPKKYEFDHSKYPTLNLPTVKENYGVIAQDLEEILPSLIKETPIPDGKQGFLKETIKAVNYIELIPILIQAVKDQQTQIQEQQAQIQEQQKSINLLTSQINGVSGKQGGQTTAATGIDVLLSDNDVAVIDQNHPNPFDKETIIGYYLPQSVRHAAVQFTNEEGKVIKTLEISSRGKGSLNIYGADLSQGIYTYSLIADGKIIASKKMQIIR